jgi:hypothetical protein
VEINVKKGCRGRISGEEVILLWTPAMIYRGKSDKSANWKVSTSLPLRKLEDCEEKQIISKKEVAFCLCIYI